MKVGNKVMVPSGRVGVLTHLYTGFTGTPCAWVEFGNEFGIKTRDAFAIKDLILRPEPAPAAASAEKCAPGSKYDSNKPDWSLVQWKAIERYVRVLTFGATKYDRDNWKQVPNLRNRYLAACMRHFAAYTGGEKLDPESGEHHLAHAICCLAFMLEDIIEKGDDK